MPDERHYPDYTGSNNPEQSANEADNWRAIGEVAAKILARARKRAAERQE